jgi:hypothetical protein
VFLVKQRREGWAHVYLPTRPNLSTGWIRGADVELALTSYRVRVQLASHRLTLFKRGKAVMRTKIAKGRAVSPTPTGRYYVTDLIRPPDPKGFYGPYALGLSAHSPVYTSYAGGDGQVGLHGTNRPSALGTDVSHGCLRVSNRGSPSSPSDSRSARRSTSRAASRRAGVHQDRRELVSSCSMLRNSRSSDARWDSKRSSGMSGPWNIVKL